MEEISVNSEQEKRNGRFVDILLIVSGVGFMVLACGLLVVYFLFNGVSSFVEQAENVSESNTAVYDGPSILHVAPNSRQIDAISYSHEMPVVVMFDATWCRYCRELKPILEDEARAANGDFLLVEVDIDDCPDLASKYYANSVPTVVAFVDGKQADRFVGSASRSYVRNFISDLPSPQ